MRAYSNIEPFGFDIENFRAGMTASTIARAAGVRSKPSDFYPTIGAPVNIDTQTDAEQIALLTAVGNAADSKPS